MNNTPVTQIIDQFRVNGLIRNIKALQAAQKDEFTFKRVEMIIALKAELKNLLNQY